MEIIRRKTDYALRSLLYMADSPQGQVFTINTIAKKQKVPAAFLRKIFQGLASKKIISSQTGPGGGFSLLKSPQRISLKEVLEAVQGDISLSNCLFESRICSRAEECVVRDGLSIVQNKLAVLLDKYSLKDFLAR